MAESRFDVATRKRVAKWIVRASVLAITVALVAWWFFLREDPLAHLPTIDFRNTQPRVASAIRSFQNDVVNQPYSGQSWGHLAMVLMANLFSSEAEVCFVQAQRLDPDNFLWPYLQGINRGRDDPEAALPRLRQSTELHPDLPVTRMRLAESLMDLGQLDEAETHLQAVIRADPENARAQLAMGRIALFRGDMQNSLLWAKKATRQPVERGARLLMAQIYHRLQDRKAAAEQMEALERLPEDLPLDDPYLDAVFELRVDLNSMM